MAMTKHQSDRAYAMAESWAKDPQRLSALLYENMHTEDWGRICESLAKQIVAITDNSSHEQCLRKLMIEANAISGVIIETVFLPIAERMVKQDSAEESSDSGFDQAKAIRKEQLIQEAA